MAFRVRETAETTRGVWTKEVDPDTGRTVYRTPEGWFASARQWAGARAARVPQPGIEEVARRGESIDQKAAARETAEGTFEAGRLASRFDDALDFEVRKGQRITREQFLELREVAKLGNRLWGFASAVGGDPRDPGVIEEFLAFREEFERAKLEAEAREVRERFLGYT